MHKFLKTLGIFQNVANNIKGKRSNVHGNEHLRIRFQRCEARLYQIENMSKLPLLYGFPVRKGTFENEEVFYLIKYKCLK